MADWIIAILGLLPFVCGALLAIGLCILLFSFLSRAISRMINSGPLSYL